jgi:hypothetical protein
MMRFSEEDSREEERKSERRKSEQKGEREKKTERERERERERETLGEERWETYLNENRTRKKGGPIKIRIRNNSEQYGMMNPSFLIFFFN